MKLRVRTIRYPENRETNLAVAERKFNWTPPPHYGGAVDGYNHSSMSVEQKYDTKPSEVKHIDPANCNYPERSPELEQYWETAVREYTECDNILPSVSLLAFKRGKPDWVPARNEKAIRRECKDWLSVADIQKKLDEVECELFTTENVPTSHPDGRVMSAQEISEAYGKNEGRRNYLTKKRLDLLDKLLILQKKLG